MASSDFSDQANFINSTVIMAGGFEQTIRLLAKSNNRAASELLKKATRSSHQGLQKAAYTEMVSSGGQKALTDYLYQLDTLDPHIREVFAQNPGRLAGAIRVAFMSRDPVLQKNAVRAAIIFRVYDLIPTLLHFLTDRVDKRPVTDVPFSELLNRLTKYFVGDIENNHIAESYQHFILLETKDILIKATREFRRNDDPVILKVFLMLGPYVHDNDFQLGQFFRNPTHPIYVVLGNLVQTVNDSYIFQFILESLEAPRVPGFVLAAISNRTDFAFLDYFFKNMELPVSRTFQENVKRIHRLDWISSVRSFLPQLSEKAQLGLLELLHFAGITQEELFQSYLQIAQFGKPAARCIGMKELVAFPIEETQTIIENAIDDENPTVQATAIGLLRNRNNPLLAARLIQKIDSPYEAVRVAARALLPEFQMRRFLESYDQLNNDQRIATLRIVRKVDPDAMKTLTQELLGGEPAMKVKAIRCIELGGLVVLMEEPLCSLLLHEDIDALKVKAANLLAYGKREISRHTLLKVSMQHNESEDVRLAVKTSLDFREKNKNMNMGTDSGDNTNSGMKHEAV